LLQFQDEKVRVVQAVKIWAERLRGKADALAPGLFEETLRILRIAIVFGQADPAHKKSPPREFPAAGPGLT